MYVDLHFMHDENCIFWWIIVEYTWFNRLSKFQSCWPPQKRNVRVTFPLKDFLERSVSKSVDRPIRHLRWSSNQAPPWSSIIDHFGEFFYLGDLEQKFPPKFKNKKRALLFFTTISLSSNHLICTTKVTIKIDWMKLKAHKIQTSNFLDTPKKTLLTILKI